MENLHSNQPVLSRGSPLDSAGGAVIMLHGRGASAEDILGLVEELQVPGLTYLAPQAARNTWYPYSFLEPVERNEPWLSSALQLVASIVRNLADAGMPHSKVGILGFSQGACLATEFVVRNPTRYAGLIAFTGGLIGADGALAEHSGDLEGTPCFLGAGDPDPHVPWQRVKKSGTRLSAMGGNVTVRRYPGMGHTINQDEMLAARQVLAAIHINSRSSQG